ncbi:Uncharacterised protein [uncultured archaeon]|nr:Uncharacterised protein [uncultured archaeon]
MKKRAVRDKNGVILIDNIVFIVLDLIFLAILVLFLYKQGSGAVMMEQAYAKNAVLLIDAGKPGMLMKLNMADAIAIAAGNGISKENIIKINGNVVTVKLSDKSSYSYSFFNNVDASAYPDVQAEDTKDNYIIKINKYN